MLKKNFMRLLVVIVAAISSMVVVTILLLDNNKTMEYILSVLSISVTLILGVTTYYQVDTQMEIDMMDKTPSMKCKFVKEEEIITDSKFDIMKKEIVFYPNKEFCCTENFAGSTVDALLRLDFVNNTNVVIQRVEFSELVKQEGKETKRRLLFKRQGKEIKRDLLNYRAEAAINYINNPQADFLKKLNEEREPGVYWNVGPNEQIQVYFVVPFNASEIKKKILLEMKTLQGYKYTETIHICAQNCGFMASKGIMYLVNTCEISVERQK